MAHPPSEYSRRTLFDLNVAVASDSDFLNVLLIVAVKLTSAVHHFWLLLSSSPLFSSAHNNNHHVHVYFRKCLRVRRFCSTHACHTQVKKKKESKQLPTLRSHKSYLPKTCTLAIHECLFFPLNRFKLFEFIITPMRLHHKS